MSTHTSPAMKVLIVSSWYPRQAHRFDGIFIQQQAEALSTEFDVAVIHVELGNEDTAAVVTVENGLTVSRASVAVPAQAASTIDSLRILYAITLGYRRKVLQAVRALERTWGRPDIIHAHASIPAAMGANSLSHHYRVPYVITEHQAEFMLDGTRFLRMAGRFRARQITRSMQSAYALVGVGSRLASRLASEGFNERVIVVPNMLPDSACVAPSAAVPSDPVPQLIHVSLMRSYEKNLPMLLDALRIVMERGHAFRMLLVGDGPDRELTEAAARQMGLLPDRVEFTGALAPTELRHLYESSAFSVVSSRFETFCMAAVESLAAGCPVVSTKCGGPEDYLDERVGVLVENDDAKAMADAIVSMLSEYQTYDRLALSRHVCTQFSKDAILPRIRKVYEEALEHQRR